MATAVTRKGQVTILKPVRDAVGLRPGTMAQIGVENGRAVVQAMPKDEAAEREARRADMPIVQAGVRTPRSLPIS